MAAVECCSRCSLAEDFHRYQFYANLAQLRADESFCDISININGAIFSAHKVVLSAATDYFNAMFLSGMTEKNSKEVTLQGFDVETFTVLLDYMYSGELRLTQGNAASVLIASDMLSLKFAVKRCLNFLSENITSENCVMLWILADRYNFNTLFFQVEKFVNLHFSEISENENFYEIEYPYLMSLLCSEDVQIEDESQLLSTVIRWVLYDKDDRFKHFPEMLGQVRLPMISEAALAKEVSEIEHQDLKTCVGALIEKNKDYSKSVMKASTSTENSTELCSNFLRFCDFETWYHRQHIPRKSSRKRVLVIGGFSSARSPGDLLSLISSDDESCDSVEMFDTYGGEWEIMAPLNQPRSSHCAVKCRNLVYVLGGESELLISDSVEVYNPVENSWRFLPQSMTTPRTSFGAAVIDDTIFAIGGWVGTELGISIECYETRNPNAQWRVIDELPSKRYAFGAIAHEGMIYVVGGVDENSNDLATVEAYHPASKSWVTLPDMLERRSQVAVAVCGNYLYALGGSNIEAGALSSIEKFCFETNTWTQCTQMKFTRAAPACAVWDGKIFVFCGKLTSSHSTNNITSDSAEVYSPETDEWCMLVRAPTSRGEAAAVVV